MNPAQIVLREAPPTRAPVRRIAWPFGAVRTQPLHAHITPEPDIPPVTPPQTPDPIGPDGPPTPIQDPNPFIPDPVIDPQVPPVVG
ncbi:hypothetical protein BH09PSE6_BH09PSE6_32250 [soil metagenome]